MTDASDVDYAVDRVVEKKISVWMGGGRVVYEEEEEDEERWHSAWL